MTRRIRFPVRPSSRTITPACAFHPSRSTWPRSKTGSEPRRIAESRSEKLEANAPVNTVTATSPSSVTLIPNAWRRRPACSSPDTVPPSSSLVIAHQIPSLRLWTPPASPLAGASSTKIVQPKRNARTSATLSTAASCTAG